ncbi:MAG TPA: LpqB family beta-propeller domain-containing protein [Marmoricola sp.]|nr:LpqB family beta-propeller domain-containing protein [Marmoricola sp.]
MSARRVTVTRTTRARLVSLALFVLVLSGCSTLPVSGDVHSEPARAGEATNQAPYFAPPGPTKGDSQEQIVRGFLLAMQANPPSTAVARSFLSSRAKATWRPGQGTIVYDAATVETESGQVVARLRGAHQLSPHGVWLDGTDSTTTTFPMSLVDEDGQWRIANPPNVLAVPASYFSSLFVPFNLYWFDRTGTVLVPTTVYVPRGEETATNLVRGLLAGPPPVQQPVVVSAFPGHALLDFAVVVNDAGIAEVPLGPEVLRLAPADLNRLVVQLAWTLRQVPGIDRLRITVDGAPVALPNGSSDVSVEDGAGFGSLVNQQRDLLVISGGRIVRDDGDHGVPISGPFGQPGYALRSLAWDAREHVVAAVAGSGRRAYVAPERGGSSRVQTVLDGATDLLRPAYDRFGGLWLVDRARGGAVVHVVRNGRDRVIQVPGVSGRRISAFTVTGDGTSLVAVLSTGTNPTVEVSGLVRKPNGRVESATPARALQLTGADLGPARDVSQNGATSVAVLSRPPSGPDQITYVQLDGSPGPQLPEGAGAPDTVPGSLSGVITSPDPALPLRVVSSDGRLFTYSDTGSWTRASLAGVLAAAYAE